MKTPYRKMIDIAGAVVFSVFMSLIAIFLIWNIIYSFEGYFDIIIQEQNAIYNIECISPDYIGTVTNLNTYSIAGNYDFTEIESGITYTAPLTLVFYRDNNMTLELNTIYNENCLDTMQNRIPENYVDLTVTSPPYDNLRVYSGFTFEYKPVIEQLYRITKQGGIVVWVVGDATKDGSESGTSFKQALYFMEVGFNLHDTMIYAKKAVGAVGSRQGYNQAFEYMFVFSKGKINTFNPIKDLIPKNAGKKQRYVINRSNVNGYNNESKEKITPQSSKRTNVWEYVVGFTGSTDKVKHPASFPEKLAEDHILSWSNENDIVYDPFMGSGTTAKVSLLLNRKFIGSELSSEYCEQAEKRIALVRNRIVF